MSKRSLLLAIQQADRTLYALAETSARQMAQSTTVLTALAKGSPTRFSEITGIGESLLSVHEALLENVTHVRRSLAEWRDDIIESLRQHSSCELTQEETDGTEAEDEQGPDTGGS